MLRPRRFEHGYDPGPVQIQARKVHFDSCSPSICERSPQRRYGLSSRLPNLAASQGLRPPARS
jgi:hypothetical protein